MYNCNPTGNSETLGRRNTENLRTGLNRKVEGNVKKTLFNTNKIININYLLYNFQ